MSAHRPEPKVWPTQRKLDVSPNPERQQRGSFLLLPPGEGPTVAALLEQGPSVHSAQLVTDRWLGELARKVRQAEVSLEFALLAACIHGEHRGLPPTMVPGALDDAPPLGIGQKRSSPKQRDAS